MSNEELILCCLSALLGEGWVYFVSEEYTAFWSLSNAEFGISCASVTSGEVGLVLSLLSDAEFGLCCSVVLFSGHQL
jgi:hypothetical protein